MTPRSISFSPSALKGRITVFLPVEESTATKLPLVEMVAVNSPSRLVRAVATGTLCSFTSLPEKMRTVA